MAELTLTVAVTTGTQYVTGSTGSIYTFDGSQPASFTFPWVASGTIRLEQSGSSNDGHPLIFSTSNSAVLATMKAGIISSGVTYYLDGASNQSDYTNTTTFNAATTRYIEIAPASQTDFYFACWVHGIGMGGIMDITQDTWGALSWSDHDWGDQGTVTVFPSGLSITATLGEAQSYPEEGWGSDAWGVENWGQTGLTVPVTGLSITATLGDLAYAAALDGWGRGSWGEDDWGDDTLSIPVTGFSMTGSLGTPGAASEQGWGRETWGSEPWGDSNSPVVGVSGFAITASLGTLPYAASESGWGRDEWGYGNWGENTTTVVLDGFEMTGAMGLGGWGRDTWGYGVWGEESILTVEIGTPLTGLAITGSLGTPTINHDFIFTLPDSLLMTAHRGSISINNGADHTQGLGGLPATMSLGTVEVADVVFGPTTFTITGALGAAAAGDVQRVSVTGLSITGSQGSLGSIPDMAVGSGSFAITGSVGSLTITDMQVGLTGLEITSTLGSGGVAPLGYKDVDITGNTSYTYIEHSA